MVDNSRQELQQSPQNNHLSTQTIIDLTFEIQVVGWDKH